MSSLLSKTLDYFKQKKLANLPLILNYHRIYNETSENDDWDPSSISKPIFEKHIAWLKKHYELIFIDELFERSQKNQSLEGYASITFDDGLSESLNIVQEVCSPQNIPCTFFLITSSLENTPLWFDILKFCTIEKFDQELCHHLNQHIPKCSLETIRQLRKIMKSGQFDDFKKLSQTLTQFLNEKQMIDKFNRQFSKKYLSAKDIEHANEKLIHFGSHTHHHLVLANLDDETQKSELSLSKTILESLDCQLSQLLAVPFGGKDHYSKTTIRLSHEIGYTGYLSCVGQNLNNYIDSFQSLESGELNRFMPFNSPSLISPQA